MVVGLGENNEETTRDHDRNLDAVLQYCMERNLKSNVKKLRLRQRVVPFIGHLLTSEGLFVDPSKFRAIQKMPPPRDVAAVQCLLGLVQYHSKFLPHLSELTRPLKELTKKDVVWTWGLAQQ